MLTSIGMLFVFLFGHSYDEDDLWSSGVLNYELQTLFGCSYGEDDSYNLLNYELHTLARLLISRVDSQLYLQI